MAKQDDLEIQIEPEETKFEISLSTNRFKAEEIFTGVKQEGTYSETTYAKADSYFEGSFDRIDDYFRRMRESDPNELEKQLEMSHHAFWFGEVVRISKRSDKQDKIQVSLASTQKLLLEAWAEAEGTPGVAAEAMAIGMAQLRKDGTIPRSAVASSRKPVSFVQSLLTTAQRSTTNFWALKPPPPASI